MRLLYVIDSLAPGGAETSLAEMAPILVLQGVDLHVLPLGTRLDLAARISGGGAQVHRRTGHQGRLGNIAAVRKVARSVEPDLIHTTLYEADLAGRAAAWALGIPVSTSLVNDSYGMSHYAESRTWALHAARTLDAATARGATRFHAITQAIADSVAPRLGIPRGKIDVIPRGRDPFGFPFRPPNVRERMRTSLGITPDAPVVLSVGRLEPQKGHEHLVRAASVLSEVHPDVVVLIAGKEGRSSARLRDLANQQGADIRFLGHREDVPGLLTAADVLCFPSEREGFGGVLVEALAVGCPIVASDIPTSREVLTTENGPVGLLRRHNPDQLADGILSILQNPRPAHARAERGRARFEQNFTIDAVTAQMVEFFSRSAHPKTATSSARRRRSHTRA